MIITRSLLVLFTLSYQKQVYYKTPLANSRFQRFMPDFIGRLLVNGARKTNACFAVACFSFALIISSETALPALPAKIQAQEAP